MRIAIATLLAALAATHANAQPSLAEVCQDADMPTKAEYDGNPTAYADNFCALRCTRRTGRQGSSTAWFPSFAPTTTPIGTIGIAGMNLPPSTCSSCARGWWNGTWK